MTAAGDRWWPGFEGVVLGTVAPGARVLDVGCGDGGLVERLAASGLDAVGVDPGAPERPRLIRRRVEELRPSRPFDAICAVMSLHHAALEPALSAIARLLRPGGRVLIAEFAWETYDERAAAWIAAHDPAAADPSVPAWRAEHADHQTGAAMRAALAEMFDLREELACPYLARMLGNRHLEVEEAALIDRGSLPPLGRRWIAAGR